MITNKTNFRTKMIATFVAVFMLFANTGVAISGIYKALKAKLYAYETSISISNGDFSSPVITSSSTLPATASSWTAINQIDGVTAGVITLDTTIATEEKIDKKYKLKNWISEYSAMNDKQVLMINSEDNAVASGYRSQSIEMAKNGYYVVQFMAYTQASTNASAKLTGVSELEKDDYVLSFTTNAMWKQYKIYVQTSSLTTVSPTLELWLGTEGKNTSAGAVFFDAVSVKSYDQTTFMTALNNDISANASYKYINLNKNYVSASKFINNPSFETALSASNWTMLDSTNLVGSNKTISGIYSVANFNNTDTKITDTILNTNVYGNQNALLINNIESGFVGYKSSYFTAGKNSLYKLSFLAKTGEISDSATVKLVERNPYTNQTLSDGSTNNNYYVGSSYEAKTFSLTVSTSGYTNELTNGWKEFSFYIQSNPFIDEELNLEVSVSGTGYALFDHFTLAKITTNEYTSNYSNGTEANLNQYATETAIANGNFNLITIETVEDKYPYTPKNWTINTTNNNSSVLNGVINTAEDNSALGVPTIPAISNKYTNNNVLMLGNIASNAQKYTSSGKTVEADKYVRISVDVLTSNLETAKAGIKILADDVVLGQISNIDTNGVWKTYTLLLKTGFQSKTINVELNLGDNAKGRGFAFFDNVNYVEIEKEDYTDDTTNKKIDLVKTDFSNLLGDEQDGIYESTDYSTTSTNSSVTSGVIDTAKYGTTEGYNSSLLANPSHPEGENSYVLMIKSNNDTYYTYKSNNQYTFESGSYYQISINVKTDSLSQDDENKQYKDSNKKQAYPYGASINIDGIDAKFVGIDTESEWKTYTVYVKNTSENNVQIELSLGSENASTKGAVYYSSVEVKKIEQDDYLTGIEVLENKNVDNVLAIGNTDKQDSNKDNTSSDANSVQFDWLLVPSLIFGIVILFAVIAVIVRNTKRKSHKKVNVQKENAKDNLKKLSNSHKAKLADINARKAKFIDRQNNVASMLNTQRSIGTTESNANAEKLEKEYAELNKKIAELNNERKEEIKNYKQKLNELKEQEKYENARK